MTIVSLNVGLPREVDWHGRPVSTGIFKSPVSGRVPLRRLNFDGDRQADLTVHGGHAKAVYCYPAEHYEDRNAELGRDLPFGAFGENLTTTDLDERSVHLGDEFESAPPGWSSPSRGSPATSSGSGSATIGWSSGS